MATAQRGPAMSFVSCSTRHWQLGRRKRQRPLVNVDDLRQQPVLVDQRQSLYAITESIETSDRSQSRRVTQSSCGSRRQVMARIDVISEQKCARGDSPVFIRGERTRAKNLDSILHSVRLPPQLLSVRSQVDIRRNVTILGQTTKKSEPLVRRSTINDHPVSRIENRADTLQQRQFRIIEWFIPRERVLRSHQIEDERSPVRFLADPALTGIDARLYLLKRHGRKEITDPILNELSVESIDKWRLLGHPVF